MNYRVVCSKTGRTLTYPLVAETFAGEKVQVIGVTEGSAAKPMLLIQSSNGRRAVWPAVCGLAVYPN